MFNGDCGKRIIQGYADADWGGDLDTRRSTTGYLFKVYGEQSSGSLDANPLWLFQQQKRNTWHQQMQLDKQHGCGSFWKTFKLVCQQKLQSQSSMTTMAALRCREPVHHERSKHIAMRHHFLRGKVEDKTVKLDFVPSADNLADILTKALPQPAFERLKEQMGISKYQSPA